MLAWEQVLELSRQSSFASVGCMLVLLLCVLVVADKCELEDVLHK